MNPSNPIPTIAYTMAINPKTRLFVISLRTWLIIPNPGKILMYTSGCPKNQNKCWYKIGSPPDHGVKKFVPKRRSHNNIVIAPANTGSESRSKYVVTIIDHG